MLGVVLSISENVPAFDETAIKPDHPVRAVLEVRAGLSKRAKIQVRDQFDLSGIGKAGHFPMQEQGPAVETRLPRFIDICSNTISK